MISVQQSKSLYARARERGLAFKNLKDNFVSINKRHFENYELALDYIGQFPMTIHPISYEEQVYQVELEQDEVNN